MDNLNQYTAKANRGGGDMDGFVVMLVASHQSRQANNSHRKTRLTAIACDSLKVAGKTQWGLYISGSHPVVLIVIAIAV